MIFVAKLQTSRDIVLNTETEILRLLHIDQTIQK
jgi:hypothetical protein